MGEYVITEHGTICPRCMASTSGHCPEHPDIRLYLFGPSLMIQAEFEFQTGQADDLLLAAVYSVFADYILCPDKRSAYAHRMRDHLRELVAMLPASAVAKLRAEVEDVLPIPEKAEGGDSWRSTERYADLVGRMAREP